MWSYIITDFSCLWLHKKASILSPQRVVLCVWVPSTPRRERQSFKSKLAKQHNRKCEGQEDRASSLSLHRQQSAAALFNSRELIHLLLVMPRLSSLGPFRRTQRDWVQASFYLTSHDFLNFQSHPPLSLSLPQSLRLIILRRLQTFQSNWCSFTHVSQLSDIYISTEIKYLHREIPEILTAISPGA